MKKKLRIAILADPLDRQYAGIHVYTRELIQAMARLGHPHEIFIVRPEHKGDIENVTEIVVPILPVPGHQSLRLFVQIPRLMRRMKMDVVIEPGHFGPFNLPKSIKRITVIHDITPILFPHMHTFQGQFLQRIFLPGILKRADHILVNSFYTQSDLTKAFPFCKAKSTVTLLGKDAIFQPDLNQDILAKYGIQQPYILFTGTIEPRKNLSTLLKAFELFKAQSQLPHKLVWVGKWGWKSEDIQQQIENSPYQGDIIQTGYIAKEDLPGLYSQAEIFVYPSLYEGFGLPVLEAMACGAPVITSNTSSLPEAGGPAALYFDPQDPKALAACIHSLAKNPALRAEKRKASLLQASNFDWRKTARQSLDVIESVCK